MFRRIDVLVLALAGVVMDNAKSPGVEQTRQEPAQILRRSGIHREAPNDPPAESRALPEKSSGAPSGPWTRGGFTSVQVNVSTSGLNIPGDAANEPSLAIDPTDPNNMVIGWRQFNSVQSDFRQAGRAFSHDGGQTWTFPGVLQPGEFSSDPVLDSDSEGNFYYYALQPVRGPLDWSCYLYKSTDGGVTFPGGGGAAYGGDKPWMTIDKTGGLGNGNLYVAWSPHANCCGPNLFTRSTDGGLNFMSPISVPLSPFLGTLAVAGDGALYITGAADSPPGGAPLMRSSNARDPNVTPTFDLAVTVNMGGSTSFGGPNPDGLLGQVYVAIDKSNGLNAGNVYLCGSVDPPGPGDPLDVMFARSTDGGQNWNSPLRVNDDPAGNGAWQWFAMMDVASNGRIDVVWNDTRSLPAGNLSELYYSYSFDGGVTWSLNTPVSPPFNHTLGYPNQNKIGDYYAIRSDECGASVAYAATFNSEQDVYFLRVSPLIVDCPVEGGADSSDLGFGSCHDCNGNGMEDACDIISGLSEDCDQNAVPDECQNDADGDGLIDPCDVCVPVGRRIPGSCLQRPH